MGQLHLPTPRVDTPAQFTLRPYQLECLTAIRTALSEGEHRLLVSMATGLGKTVCFAHLPGFLQLPGRWLILAHRQELLEQAAEKLRNINPHLNVAIEQADRRAGDADVIVASVPTLQRKRLAAINPEEFAGVICDEAHHAVAETYRKIFNHFGLMGESSKMPLLGFTATPKRGDGLGLSSVFQNIIYDYDIRRGIVEGYLSPLAGYRIKTESNLDNVDRKHGEFVQSQLATEINTDVRNQLIVDKYLEFALGRRAIMFCAGVEHAHALSKTFSDSGVPSAAIDGTTPSRERQDILRRFSDGDLHVVSNCGVLTEGFDDPGVSAILMARPTTSSLLYTQIIGRGTRLAPEKEDCLVLDFVDNSSRHTVCNLASLFGLPRDIDPKGRKITDVIKDEEEKREKKEKRKAEIKAADLKVSASKINFFNAETPEEIKRLSPYSWIAMSDGEYHLPLQGKYKHRMVLEDKGDSATLTTYNRYNRAINHSRWSGVEYALREADRVIRAEYSEFMNLSNRNASWRGKPASQKQIGLLRKLGLYEEGDGLTKGEASDMIDRMLSGRSRKRA